MRLVGHVACTRDRRGADRILMGKPGEKDHLENKRIILEWIFKK
jgi:hypothetical protein